MHKEISSWGIVRDAKTFGGQSRPSHTIPRIHRGIPQPLQSGRVTKLGHDELVGHIEHGLQKTLCGVIDMLSRNGDSTAERSYVQYSDLLLAAARAAHEEKEEALAEEARGRAKAEAGGVGKS